MPLQPHPVKILLLGGTGEATKLVQQAAMLPHLTLITSLAGRTHQPHLPPGTVRVGGFGGVAGLVAYLQDQSIAGILDATHPFAQQMSWNAAIAAAQLQIPCLRLERPPWQPVLGDRWIEVPTLEAAATALPATAQRLFLTIGRQQLAPFVPLQQYWFLIRSIDPPDATQPLPNGKLILERGPFSLAQERTLLQQYQIDTVISKNSGGSATYAKIQAARELQLPVVMVQRPPLPDGITVATVEAAIAWLRQQWP